MQNVKLLNVTMAVLKHVCITSCYNQKLSYALNVRRTWKGVKGSHYTTANVVRQEAAAGICLIGLGRSTDQSKRLIFRPRIEFRTSKTRTISGATWPVTIDPSHTILVWGLRSSGTWRRTPECLATDVSRYVNVVVASSRAEISTQDECAVFPHAQ
jgi:hypothetical protein